MAARGSYAVAGAIVLGFFLVLVQVKSTPDNFNWYPMPEALVLTALFVLAAGAGVLFEVLSHRADRQVATLATPQPGRLRARAPGVYRHGKMTALLDIKTKSLKVVWTESGAPAGSLDPARNRGGYEAYDAEGNLLGWVKDKEEGMARIERYAA